MDNPIRVLIVDDHIVVRKGVCALLLDADDGDTVGEADDGRAAIDEARRLAPQVILMDLKLPGVDGVEATRAILADQPETRIVALTSTDAEEEVLAAIEAGALGYLAKTSRREDLIEAIRQVAQGEAWLPPRITRRLLIHLKSRSAAAAPETLTERERAVLACLARGWSNRRIAKAMGIGEITVRTHVSHVIGKLGVNNRVEAALQALRSGLTSLQDA